MLYTPDPTELNRLWLKVYFEAILTEDGLFLKDELPDAYGGAELAIELPLLMIFAQDSGAIMQLEFPDFLQVQDKDKQKGIGYTYELLSETISVAAAGPSAFIAEPVVVRYEDDDRFSEGQINKMEFFLKRSLVDQGY